MPQGRKRRRGWCVWCLFVIHEFASSGWEQRGHFGNFYDWLQCAVEDFIELDG